MRPCNLSSGYLDGRLQKAEHRAFESHLRSCDKCRETVDKWRDFESSLKVWAHIDEPVAITAGQSHELMERARDRHGQTFLPVLPTLAWGAAAMVVCLIYVLILSNNPSPMSSNKASNPIATTVKIIVPDAAAIKINSLQPGETIVAPQVGRLLAEIGRDRLGLSSTGRLRLLAADKKDTTLELLEGTVACNVAPRINNGEFAIKAGDYTVRVVGTKFMVSRSPKLPLKVVVTEGTVEVRNRSGVHWRISRGETFAIDAASQIDSSVELLPSSTLLTRLLDNSAASDIEPLVADRAAARPAPSRTPLQDMFVRTDEHKETQTKEIDPPISKDTGAPNSKSKEIWRRWIVDGQPARARVALQARLRSVPRDSEAWALLADCERKTANWHSALHAYEKVAALAEPEQAARAKYMAATIVQKNLKNHKRAALLFEEYLQSRQGTRQLRDVAKLNLSRSLIVLGENIRARKLLEAVIESQGDTFVASNAKRMLEQIESETQDGM